MSTNRSDLVDGIATMMAAFIAAHPTLLRRHFDARPKTMLTDWPASYLDTLGMTIHYDSGLRETIFNPELVFVDRETDANETSDRIDALVDSMTDHLDSYPHLVAGTSWSDAEWAEEAVPLSDGTSATGIRLRITGLSFLNGRP
jgi:hypothetical protein